MPIAREIFFVGSMGVPVDAPLTYIAALMGQIGLASVASRHITDELRDQLREVGSVKASIPLAELRSVISPSIDIDRHRIRLDPVSYTHLDVYKRQAYVVSARHWQIRTSSAVGNPAEAAGIVHCTADAELT